MDKIKLKKSDLLKLPQDELLALLKKFQQVDESRQYRTLESYWETAHQGQIDFHKAPHRIRYFIGSNRSGKSTGGAVETLLRCLGMHPYRKNRVPIKAACVLQDFENHCKRVIEPKILQWAPKNAIVDVDRNQTGAWRQLGFNTGSTLDFLSHDQHIKVFEGSDYDVIWYDEPPPQDIFNALWRGLTDRGGDCYITGTPLMTGAWMYQDILKAEAGDPLRWRIYVDIEQNASNIGEGDKSLGMKRIKEFADLLNEDEREARLKGRFMQLRGLIFKGWRRSHHLIPEFEWPQEWPIWESIDPHPNKPWAVSWIGMAENGAKILLRSGKFEGTIEDVSERILYERTQIDVSGGNKPRINRCLIDNAASVPVWQRSYQDPTARRASVREELERIIGPMGGGPRVETAPKNVRGKIDIFQSWLRIGEDGKSQFYAFDNPSNSAFIDEIESYCWDTKRGGLLNGMKDSPKKENDDVLDSIMQVALTAPRTEPGHVSPVVKAWRADTWKM